MLRHEQRSASLLAADVEPTGTLRTLRWGLRPTVSPGAYLPPLSFVPLSADSAAVVGVIYRLPLGFANGSLQVGAANEVRLLAVAAQLARSAP